jgi:hypothetical protein
MSPERTNNVTSLPVRPDRSQRADQQAPASDFFATLLDAHADRKADRAPSRRERQPSDDRRPVDRPDSPADIGDRAKPAPAADQPASEPAPTDEPTQADKAAAAAAASAMLGLLAAVAPQQPAAQPAQPAAEPVAVAPQAAPVAQPVAAVVPQAVPAAPAIEETVVEPQVPASAPVVGVATLEGAETAGFEGDEPKAPVLPTAPGVESVDESQTLVAGRASVADSGNTRPGDRRSEGVSGGGADARPTGPTTRPHHEPQGCEAQASSRARATSNIPSKATTETRSFGSWLCSVPFARLTQVNPCASSALASDAPPVVIRRGE